MSNQQRDELKKRVMTQLRMLMHGASAYVRK